MVHAFGSVSTPAGLKELNEYLLTRSYIDGFQASRDDLAVFSALATAPDAKAYPNAARWYSHIHALLGASFPGHGSGVTLAGAAAGHAAPAAAGGRPATAPVAKAAPVHAAADDDDDDDELDLFGGMTEDEKKEREALVNKAKARAAEKEKLSKSMIVLDVKPWDDETDMKMLEAQVRSVVKEGLLWGASKLVPVGFGIKKLQITCIIEDAKVPSFDAIIEDELVKDGESPFIQSCDIAAFNKL